MPSVQGAELVVGQAKQFGGIALVVAGFGQRLAKRAALKFANGLREGAVTELKGIRLARRL